MSSARFLSLNGSFEKVLDSLPDGLIVIDSSQTIVYVNQTAEWLFGYHRSDLLDSKLEMLIPERFRSEHDDHALKFIKDPYTRSMGATKNLYARYSDGAEFPAEVGLSPIQTLEGLFISISIRDISEREREREDHARQKEYARALHHERESLFEALLIGDSPAARMLRAEVKKHSEHDENLLLFGERGSGEEAMARSIHRKSQRSEQPFLAVDSGLLGTNYGMPLFTDQNRGALELAKKGTVFLSRLTELPMPCQKRLLQFLNEMESGPRIICASNRELRDLVARELFLPALFKVLAPHKAYLPSIHQRRDDLPEIVKEISFHKAALLGKDLTEISEEAISVLQNYDWSGNFNELQRVLSQSVAETKEPVLKPEHIALDQQVYGGYTLERKLGAGGMGEVWFARHKLLSRVAAVKLIQRESGGTVQQENSIKRFEREAKATAQLESQNTIRIYDFGYTDTGVFYYVMELLKGMDLYDMVVQFGPLPPCRVIHFLKQACLSLEEAHQVGFFHRDIKPDNLYACRLGVECDVIKVLDFGLVQTHSTRQTRLTQAGFFVGTPGYVPPESILHEEYLPSSDLYSLSSTAYTLLTGQDAFGGAADMTVVMNQLNTKPKLISPQSSYPIPRDLEELILAGLQVDPKLRPQSAREMRRILESIDCEKQWNQDRAQEWWAKYLPQFSKMKPGSKSLPTTKVRSS